MAITPGRGDGGTGVQNTTNANPAWLTIFDASLHGGPVKEMFVRSVTFDSDIRVTPNHLLADGSLAITKINSGAVFLFGAEDSHNRAALTKIEVRCSGGIANSPTWWWGPTRV